MDDAQLQERDRPHTAQEHIHEHDEDQDQGEDQDQSVAAGSGTVRKPRLVNTHIANGVVRIMHANHPEPITVLDTTELLDKPVARDLVAYGVSVLLRQAANAENPHAAVQATIEKLRKGEWKPGRRPPGAQEIDPVIEALATRLGHDIDYIMETWLPAYCRKQGLTTSDGKLRGALAREQLALHPDLAPLIARIVTNRAKMAAKGHDVFDLGSIAGGSSNGAAA